MRLISLLPSYPPPTDGKDYLANSLIPYFNIETPLENGDGWIKFITFLMSCEFATFTLRGDSKLDKVFNIGSSNMNIFDSTSIDVVVPIDLDVLDSVELLTAGIHYNMSVTDNYLVEAL